MKAAEMLILVLCIDAMLFMVNTAVYDINGTEFYGYEGSIISQAAGNDTYALRQLQEGDLPSSTNTVDVEDGGFFTDIFRSVKNWLFSNVPGAETIIMAINAVPNFLNALGLPSVFVFAIGAVWHLYGIMLLIMFIWGRE